jgi:hypothetical protein
MSDPFLEFPNTHPANFADIRAAALRGGRLPRLEGIDPPPVGFLDLISAF